MPAHTTSTTRNRSSFTGASGSRLLALLVAGALLLCHGFFGALHLLPADPTTAPEAAAAQESLLAGVMDTHEDPAVQSVGEEYFAVLVVGLLLGLLLGPLLRSAGLPEHAAPWPGSVLRTCSRVAHPARGPTIPLLQVFQL